MLNIKKNIVSKHYAEFAIYGILVCVFLIKIVFDVYCNLHYNYQFEQFGYSDWLINYQGGFVRRGLAGELLFRLYQLHPYPMKATIKAIALITFVFFFCLLLNVFIKEKWSLLTILFPLALVGANIVNYRRDFLMFLILYAVYYLFFSYYSQKKLHKIIFLQGLSVVLILLYEPSFFLFVPILGMITYAVGTQNRTEKISNTIKMWVLPIFAMVIVCLWKGGTEEAEVIWNSWEPMFRTYNDSDNVVSNIGAGVRFLGNDMISTVKYHLSVLFYLEDWPSWSAVLSCVFYIVAFPMVYFIVSRTPHLSQNGIEDINPEECMKLGTILLVQFIAMAPMFTVLSCDLGRTIPSCIYTTFFIVHLSNKFKVPLFPLQKCKHCLSCMIKGQYVFYTYVITIFCVPMAEYFGPKVENTLIYMMFHLRAVFAL